MWFLALRKHHQMILNQSDGSKWPQNAQKAKKQGTNPISHVESIKLSGTNPFEPTPTSANPFRIDARFGTNPLFQGFEANSSGFDPGPEKPLPSISQINTNWQSTFTGNGPEVTRTWLETVY